MIDEKLKNILTEIKRHAELILASNLTYPISHSFGCAEVIKAQVDLALAALQAEPPCEKIKDLVIKIGNVARFLAMTNCSKNEIHTKASSIELNADEILALLQEPKCETSSKIRGIRGTCGHELSIKWWLSGKGHIVIKSYAREGKKCISSLVVCENCLKIHEPDILKTNTEEDEWLGIENPCKTCGIDSVGVTFPHPPSCQPVQKPQGEFAKKAYIVIYKDGTYQIATNNIAACEYQNDPDYAFSIPLPDKACDRIEQLEAENRELKGVKKCDEFYVGELLARNADLQQKPNLKIADVVSAKELVAWIRDYFANTTDNKKTYNMIKKYIQQILGERFEKIKEKELNAKND